jgi:hypothetical protein
MVDIKSYSCQNRVANNRPIKVDYCFGPYN